MSARDPAVACRKAGAKVFNIINHPDHAAVFDTMPPDRDADLIDFWLTMCARLDQWQSHCD